MFLLLHLYLPQDRVLESLSVNQEQGEREMMRRNGLYWEK